MIAKNIDVHKTLYPALTRLYLANEGECLKHLVSKADLDETTRQKINQTAMSLADAARSGARRGQIIDQFLQQYGLASDEGVTLMRLCEALIRTPDAKTAYILMRDKITSGDWSDHVSKSDSTLVNFSTRGLQLSSTWISTSGGIRAKNLAAKLGDSVLRQAMEQAMAMMGEHFVLGATLEQAITKAKRGEQEGFAYSYDMLGEAAHTLDDAERYFQSYLHSANTLALNSAQYPSMAKAPGISVKLSALHPRYEYSQRDVCLPVLIDRLKRLAKIAKDANIGLTIDAEEADRLEISLLIINKLMHDPELQNWNGLGVVVQAYQRRAPAMINALTHLAHETDRSITVRLVKGAYWDAEIKRAQELGLESYPVFTRKENTDVSYLACARLLFQAGQLIFPQFATHNAHSAAGVMVIAGDNRQYEFQRLHGMGESLHIELIKKAGVHSRVYAPVGQHKDLLPYLVRRLLENGANSSFVNQLLDPKIPIAEIVRDPFEILAKNANAENTKIPSPRNQFNGKRLAAIGTDLTQSNIAQKIENLSTQQQPIGATSIINGELHAGTQMSVISPINEQEIGTASYIERNEIDEIVHIANQSSWINQSTAEERATCLFKAADLLEQNQDLFLKLCMHEAGKSYLDGVAEIREAVDFCRYYANQCKKEQMVERQPHGVIACISPWNFPLAIFLGQITGALAAGNSVIAKPAEQTPLIAFEAIKLLHKAGIPEESLHLIIGDGAKLGSHLVSNPLIKGICFTGSTRTAKIISSKLGETNRSLIPFIAETGGINAMIIDSTSLLEQAVSDVTTSAFQSAGQRCSACRVVCVQDDIADDFNRMLKGAMEVLCVGSPEFLRSDIGPVIDKQAQTMLETYKEKNKKNWPVIHESTLSQNCSSGFYVAPIAFKINSLSELTEEIFGPILHIHNFKAGELDQLLIDINALGYGLTMGLHTRIDARIDRIAALAKVGNLYVNRNQIGAVVGVQPFGGEGLSGTGPKAGGPSYIRRLSRKSSQQSLFEESQRANKESDKTKLDNNNLAIQDKIALAHGILEQNNKQDQRVFFENVSRDNNEDSKFIIETIMPLIEDLYHTTITLPGPTGERNELRREGRGVILCFGSENLAIVKKQIFLSLASGNAILIAIDKEQQNQITTLFDKLSAAGLPDNMLQIISRPDAFTYLDGQYQMDAVLCDDEDRSHIANTLCQRSGPILPVLDVKDDPERFCIERTLTVNTTAAGGNASLLAM